MNLVTYASEMKKLTLR